MWPSDCSCDLCRSQINGKGFDVYFQCVSWCFLCELFLLEVKCLCIRRLEWRDETLAWRKPPSGAMENPRYRPDEREFLRRRYASLEQRLKRQVTTSSKQNYNSPGVRTSTAVPLLGDRATTLATPTTSNSQTWKSVSSRIEKGSL